MITLNEAEAVLKCLDRWPDGLNSWFDNNVANEDFAISRKCSGHKALEHGGPALVIAAVRSKNDVITLDEATEIFYDLIYLFSKYQRRLRRDKNSLKGHFQDVINSQGSGSNAKVSGTLARLQKGLVGGYIYGETIQTGRWLP